MATFTEHRATHYGSRYAPACGIPLASHATHNWDRVTCERCLEKKPDTPTTTE
jgi:hypothetical protein